MSTLTPVYTVDQKNIINKYIDAAQKGKKADLEQTLSPNVRAEWTINKDKPIVVEGRGALILKINELVQGNPITFSNISYDGHTVELRQKITVDGSTVSSQAKITFTFDGGLIIGIKSKDTMEFLP